MKKNILIITVTAITVLFSLESCKKGENDPFLSLRTRKSRITGEWKMVSGIVTYIDTYTGGSTKTEEVYDGNTLTETFGGTTSTQNYTQSIIFEKDKTFKIVILDNGSNVTYEGGWYWIGKSKKLELKNKEAIGLTFTSTTNVNGTETIKGVENFSNIMVIDQLKNKEMVFKLSVVENKPNGDVYSTNATFTYQKQ